MLSKLLIMVSFLSFCFADHDSDDDEPLDDRANLVRPRTAVVELAEWAGCNGFLERSYVGNVLMMVSNFPESFQMTVVDVFMRSRLDLWPVLFCAYMKMRYITNPDVMREGIESVHLSPAYHKVSVSIEPSAKPPPKI